MVLRNSPDTVDEKRFTHPREAVYTFLLCLPLGPVFSCDLLSSLLGGEGGLAKAGEEGIWFTWGFSSVLGSLEDG